MLHLEINKQSIVNLLIIKVSLIIMINLEIKLFNLKVNHFKIIIKLI